MNVVTEENVTRLRKHTAVTEDPSWVTSIHNRMLTTSYNAKVI